MKKRSPLTNISGHSLFFVVATIVFTATLNGCRQNTAKSDLSNQEAASSPVDAPVIQPIAPVSEAAVPDNVPVVLSPPTETGNSTSMESQPEIDELIRLAAGPMADSVNSSLARLNTNLGKKEHTLVLMAMKSETRRWYFLTHMVSIIDNGQLQQATDLIDSYNSTWQDLLDRRARILESERDGKRVQQLLDYNKVAALKLTMLVRQRILREVFTAEQRKQYAAKFEKTPEEARD